MDPHCFDADADADPAQNLADPDQDPDPGGGGVSQPKMCIPPGKILGTPLSGSVSRLDPVSTGYLDPYPDPGGQKLPTNVKFFIF